MKNIAIITARSGSKGLIDKNIKKLNGKHLIAYSIEAAISSNCFSKIMVSTDSLRYAEIAKKYGADVPFLRSNKNSSDSASSWDCICEVLKEYHARGEAFDTVTLLQPTSPLRKSFHIQEGYQLLEEKNADSITGVCEMDHSPLWSNTLPDDLSLNDFINKEIENLPRQELPIYFRINGALYIRKINYKEDEIIIKNEYPYAYIMGRNYSIDIDTLFDFEIAEVIMNSNNIID